MGDSAIAFSARGITILGFLFAWYGIIITAGVALAIYLCVREARRVGVDPDSIIDLALIAIPAAMVGARLYYVVFEWPMFRDNLLLIFDLRSGGLAIYGAVIAGFFAVLILSKWKKIGLWKLLDIVAPALILAQAIGRWGNFFNQEAFGYAISNPALQWFPFAVYIEATGAWHYATFFYESLWCAGGYLALRWYSRRSKREGNVFAAYWLIYGFERAIVEGLRTDSLWWGPFRVSQVVSIVMFLVAAAYLTGQWLTRKAREKELAGGPVDDALKIIPGYNPDDGDFLSTQEDNSEASLAQNGDADDAIDQEALQKDGDPVESESRDEEFDDA